jgi:polar amino acid transport system substrate-binding protein
MDLPKTAVTENLNITDQLRVGLVSAPEISTFFVSVDSQGCPQGVTADLGAALGDAIGRQVKFIVAPNSGEITQALEKLEIDVAFMPVDDERRKRVDFGPSYFFIESTGLVHGDAPFESTTDLNRPNVRVVGIANTTTIRSTASALPAATMVAATSVKEAIGLLVQRSVDALTLSRDVLRTYQMQVPGSRLLSGHFHKTGVAIAVPKGKSLALAEVSRFLEEAKASGLVRRSFDRFGLMEDAVAPSEPTP